MSNGLPLLTGNLLYVCDVGTKNVSKELKKITQGRVRDRNVTWFPELVDKRELCIVHRVVVPV